MLYYYSSNKIIEYNRKDLDISNHKSLSVFIFNNNPDIQIKYFSNDQRKTLDLEIE